MPASRTLTQRELEIRYKAALSESGRRLIACGDELYLRIEGTAARQAAWYRRAATDAGRRFIRLGAFPDLDMATARRLLSGQTEEAPCVPHLGFYAARFLEASDSVSDRGRRQHLLRVLGSLLERPVSDLSLGEVRDSLQAAGLTSRVMMQMRGYLIKLMDLAVADGAMECNKFRALRVFEGQQQPAEHVRVPVRELGELFAGLQRLGKRLRSYYLLLALSCLRPGECAQLHRSWVDREQGVLSIPRCIMKNKQGDPFRIPLSWQMLAVIDYLQTLHPHCDPLFPMRSDPQRPADWRRWCTDFRRVTQTQPLALRQAARAWFAEQDVSIEVCDRCFDYAFRVQAVRAYPPSELLEQRRPVMQAWADVVCAALPQGWRDEVLGSAGQSV